MSKLTGLTTIALLKANYDQGMDYLEMFMPFVLYIISNQCSDIVEIEDVQSKIKKTFEINIPLEVLKKLFSKSKKREALYRDGGKYFKNVDFTFNLDIEKKKKDVDRELYAIGDRLFEFLKNEGLHLESEDEALSILFKFLSNQELELLLDIEYQDKPIDSSVLQSRQMRAVAKFVKKVCFRDKYLTDCINNILTGFVLQNALLLKNIATPSKVFKNLQVFLDSGFIIGLLGLKGAERELANKETLDLLKATNAHLAVFEQTLDEIKRILYVYEIKIGTQEGRNTLWQNAITRYVISERLSPSDIVQISSLLEYKLVNELGINIHSTPERKPEFTQNEEELASQLGGKNDENPKQRVKHDIDCIAAVLTLRKGAKPLTLNETNAIFMSGNSMVVNAVTKWYRLEVGVGNGKYVSPIIHHLTLSNIAWLKRPDVGSKMKLNELIALCTAALRPKRETWDKFLVHLRKLQESGELTSDESIAIVASNLIESELSKLEDIEEEVDSNSVGEIIQKVKQDLVGESLKREEELKNNIKSIDDELERINLNLLKKAELLSNVVFYFIATIIFFGSYYVMPEVNEKFNFDILEKFFFMLIPTLTSLALVTGFKLDNHKNRLTAFFLRLLTNVVKGEKKKL